MFFFNGCKVSFIGNDCLVFNINVFNEGSGKKFDISKFIFNNISYVLVVFKGYVYVFINQFNKVEGVVYLGFLCEIVNCQVFMLEDVEKEVMSMLVEGKCVIIKFSGIGYGDGICVFDIVEKEVLELICQEIKEFYELVKGIYGDCGGFFYIIFEYLIVDCVFKEDLLLKLMKYEFCVVVYLDYFDKEKGFQLKVVLVIIKIDGGFKLCEGESGDFFKSFVSVLVQVLVIGLFVFEFMKLLCSEVMLDLVGVSKDEMIDLCKWLICLVLYILVNVDQSDIIFDK